jgi:hypothetical protein
MRSPRPGSSGRSWWTASAAPCCPERGDQHRYPGSHRPLAGPAARPGVPPEVPPAGLEHTVGLLAETTPPVGSSSFRPAEVRSRCFPSCADLRWWCSGGSSAVHSSPERTRSPQDRSCWHGSRVPLDEPERSQDLLRQLRLTLTTELHRALPRDGRQFRGLGRQYSLGVLLTFRPIVAWGGTGRCCRRFDGSRCSAPQDAVDPRDAG